MFWKTYGKTILAVLVEVFILVQSYASDGTVTGDEWPKIIAGAVGVLGVYFAPARTNQPPLTPTTRGELRDRT